MQHFCMACADERQLTAFFDAEPMRLAFADARSVLVQIFAGNDDIDLLHSVLALVRRRLPTAVVVGCTSAGEICSGRVIRRALIVSLSIFASASLQPLLQPCRPGEEFATGAAIATRVACLVEPRALLLLAPPGRIDCSRLIEGVAAAPSAVTVFGGGASTEDEASTAHVFLGEEIREDAVVAVALCGASLHVRCLTSLAWKALGPPFRVTEVEGLVLRSIDGKPASGFYQRYLGAACDDHLAMLEFPMLIERDGRLLARNPVAVNRDGSLALFADIDAGEMVRLGYIDVDRIIDDALDHRTDLARFGAEAVYIYSCVCRRFTLQDDTQLETLPFQAVAPTAGFFTHGEFSSVDGELLLHNSTEVVVGLREGDGGPRPMLDVDDVPVGDDPYRLRHIRMTSRLFKFIATLTEELAQANQALKDLAERDPLTGILNRRVFNERLAAEIARCLRHGGHVSIALLDVDHFKQINDTYGHLAGDRILRSLGTAVEGAMRQTDTLFRYGGEEFAILMPETGKAGASHAAERIRRAIETHRSGRDDGEALPPITASLGVATHPEHAPNARSLLIAADLALYRAKAAGRNRVAIAGDSELTKPISPTPSQD